MKTIIGGNKTEYQIVLPKLPSATEQTAAKELKDYLQKVYGIELPIVSESEASDKAFFIGYTEYAAKRGIKGDSQENWIIKLDGDSIILTGGLTPDNRGLLYAVYHFLEDVVGVRWWNYWEEYIPEVEKLLLEENFEKKGTPVFPYRKVINYMSNTDFYYDARTRCNVIGDDKLDGGVYQKDIAALGGALHMGSPHHVHTLDKYFPAGEYFEKHPDWFGWNAAEGERVSYGHYCMTNEEFIDAVCKKILANIKSDTEKAKAAGIESPVFWSVTFPDTPDTFCQCDACRAAIEKSGGSGYTLQFVNKIAREVDKQYPEAKIETLVYQEFIDPPKDDTLPEKNVLIRIAESYSDIIHGIHAKGNAHYLYLVKAWADICKKAGCTYYVWEYAFSFFFDLPSPVAYHWSDNFKTYLENGITGIIVENERLVADMNDLNQFMLLHLAEDPYADDESLIYDFVSRYYGAGGEYVMEYLHDMKRSSIEHEVPAYCVIDNAHSNYIDPRLILCGMKNLAKAKEAVAGDAVLTRRVKWLQKHLDAAALIRYNDLKKMAAAEGLAFELDRKAIVARILETLDEAKDFPRFAGFAGGIKKEIEYFKNYDFDEVYASMPEELKSVDVENVYQFNLKNLATFMYYNMNEWFGYSTVEDSASEVGKVAKITRKDATALDRASKLFVTNRDAKEKKPLHFYIRKNEDIVDELKLYREDIKRDGYHLYKIGSVSGIHELGETMLYMFSHDYIWFGLLGAAEVFPMDACDVYLSAKFEGELYGGSKEDDDAIYLERLIIVRK